MKNFLLPLALLGALLTAGCGHLELQTEGDSERVLTGTVNFHAPEPLPSDMVVTVRLLAPAGAIEPVFQGSDVARTASDSQMGHAKVPLVLGEQTIENAGTPPVAFRIEYRADDEQLRHGLNLEARVSIGGKLRFYNVNGYGVTLSKAGEPQAVWVNATSGN